MCGICGMLRLDGTRPDRGVLEAMNETLRHRGPDSDGMHLEGPVGLAMRRLSIIDLAGGDQPISNETGDIHVIQNGEIYNYRELAQELRAKGHSFRTDSDTEVLVHLYEEEGPDFVKRLRGMFGIAVWDSPRQRLVLARDRYGIKPLYYRSAPDSLAFASELKALLELPDLSREVDLEAVEAFLAFNVIPTPLSIFREVRKLPAGHLLVHEDGGETIREYGRPRPVSKDELRRESPEALEEELRQRLSDSVRAHLVADVPVGVLLSGGIDSGVLTALAAEHTTGPVNTFTIGFDEREFAEQEGARRVARRYGTDHHELIVRPDSYELLPRISEVFDEPFADTSALPTYLVSELAAEHVKVVLSGEGADELFGGYYWYVGDVMAPRLGRIASAAKPLVDRIPSTSGTRRLDDRVKRFARGSHLGPVDRHAAWSHVFSPEARAELIERKPPDGSDPLRLHRQRYSESAGAEELTRMQDIDIGTYLVDDILTKIDRASMAHSLESRVPFLDPVVADFALALPARHKVRGLTKKRLLRRAARPLLPPENARARKRGFTLPVAAWFRGPLESFARDVLSPENVARQGYLEPAAVTAVIDEHVSGREDRSRNIWGLISLSLWLEGNASRVS
jgi:asparagine synthase (glutamine-hydrolysing)